MARECESRLDKIEPMLWCLNSAVSRFCYHVLRNPCQCEQKSSSSKQYHDLKIYTSVQQKDILAKRKKIDRDRGRTCNLLIYLIVVRRSAIEPHGLFDGSSGNIQTYQVHLHVETPAQKHATRYAHTRTWTASYIDFWRLIDIPL
jgi:hypothetical protein